MSCPDSERWELIRQRELQAMRDDGIDVDEIASAYTPLPGKVLACVKVPIESATLLREASRTGDSVPFLEGRWRVVSVEVDADFLHTFTLRLLRGEEVEGLRRPAFPRYEIREEDRQAIVLAVAKLSISRPGWTMMLREIAEGTFKAGAMFDEFVSMGPDETLHVAEVPGIKVAGYELLAKASHADAGQIVAEILLPLLHAATLSEEAKADG